MAGYTQDLVSVTFNGVTTPSVLLELKSDGTMDISRGSKAIFRCIIDEISSPGAAIMLNNGPFHQVTPIDPRYHGHDATLTFSTLAEAQAFVDRATHIQAAIAEGTHSDSGGSDI